MKIKRTVSLILVFSALFAFCSCRKLENAEGFEEQTELYALDDEGVTHEVQTTVNNEGETEYYYFDNKGNTVEVESKAIKTVKKTVKVTESTSPFDDTSETYSMTPEQQSFVEKFNNSDIENMIVDEKIDFETGDEIVADEKEVEKIVKEAETQQNAAQTAPQKTVSNYYEQLAKSEKYYMEINMKIVSDDEVTTMPVIMARNGSKYYCELSMPVSDQGNMKAQIHIADKKCTMYIPAMKAYMEIPGDYIDEMYDNLDLATKQDDGLKYAGSTKTTIDSVKYDVDVYLSPDGGRILYYYHNDVLKRIENEYDNNNYTIIEYTKMHTNPPANIFIAPKGYFNMTDLFEKDFLN